MHTLAAILLAALALPSAALAEPIAPRDGWEVHDTDLAHEALVERLNQAVKAEGLVVVTRAGPTGAAAQRGIEIPDNMVVGVFNNDYAVRVIGLSVPAMIEAPIRFYLTGDGDGTASLSYKRPSHVWVPYLDEGGDELRAIAEELDEKFAAIAKSATE